jgi:hypothetical protein
MTPTKPCEYWYSSDPAMKAGVELAEENDAPNAATATPSK